MKIRHRVNAYDPPSAVVSEAYENEIRRATEKLEREYRAAQKRYEQAQRRLDRARAHGGSKNRKRQLVELEAMVELRRVELEKYQRLMVAVPASAEHRGTKSFRPVGFGGGVL